jgi:hypothetical protein
MLLFVTIDKGKWYGLQPEEIIVPAQYPVFGDLLYETPRDRAARWQAEHLALRDAQDQFVINHTCKLLVDVLALDLTDSQQRAQAFGTAFHKTFSPLVTYLAYCNSKYWEDVSSSLVEVEYKTISGLSQHKFQVTTVG